MDNENNNWGSESDPTPEPPAEVVKNLQAGAWEEDCAGGKNRWHIPIEKIVVDDNNSRVRDMVGLEDSIDAIGLKNSVRVQEGSYRLISGRRRLEACRRLGYDSVPAEIVRCSDDEAELERIDENLFHLPLTFLEQGELLLRREDLLTKQGKRAPSHRPKKGAKFAHLTTTKDEARALDMSERTAQERKSIAKNLTVESKDLVRKTPIAQNGEALKRLSALEGEDQLQVLDAYFADIQEHELVKPGSGDKQSSGLINKHLNLFKRNNRIDATVRQQHLPLEDLAGRYHVIYADPPWRYTKNGDPLGNSPETHYETMSIEDICALPVVNIAEDNAVLFMWTTKAHIMESGTIVMPAWGFTYKSLLIWEKDRIGQGVYSRDNAEVLLVGTRGNLPYPVPKSLSNTLVKAPRDRHAQKPKKFYDLLDEYYPLFRKVELFCRESHPGWASWGNEIISVDEDSFDEGSTLLWQTSMRRVMSLRGEQGEFARRFEFAAA